MYAKGGLIEEFEEYRAEDRPDGEFKPVKERDHQMDAMRYALMYRMWGGFMEKEEENRSSAWVPGGMVDLDAMLDNYNPEPDLPMGSMM